MNIAGGQKRKEGLQNLQLYGVRSTKTINASRTWKLGTIGAFGMIVSSVTKYFRIGPYYWWPPCTEYSVQRDWIQSGCGVQWLTRHMDLILIIPFCSWHRISRTGHCVLSARSPSGPTMSFGIVGVNLFLFVQSILDFGYCRTLDYYFSLITRYLVLRTFADNSTWLIRPCRMQNDPAKNKE